jgi:hypothetical protein
LKTVKVDGSMQVEAVWPEFGEANRRFPGGNRYG